MCVCECVFVRVHVIIVFVPVCLNAGLATHTVQRLTERQRFIDKRAASSFDWDCEWWKTAFRGARKTLCSSSSSRLFNLSWLINKRHIFLGCKWLHLTLVWLPHMASYVSKAQILIVGEIFHSVNSKNSGLMVFQQGAAYGIMIQASSTDANNTTRWSWNVKTKRKQHSGDKNSKREEEEGRRRRRQRSYKRRPERRRRRRRRSAALQSLISLLARARAVRLRPVPLWARRKWATYESHYRNWLNKDTCLSATRLGWAALPTAHKGPTTTVCASMRVRLHHMCVSAHVCMCMRAFWASVCVRDI